MNRGVLAKLVFCVFVFSIYLFNYMDRVSDLTKLKLKLPKVKREVYLILEENKRLKIEIERFENPSHLMELARSPEFAHLKHPLIKDVLKVKEGIALESSFKKEFFNNKK